MSPARVIAAILLLSFIGFGLVAAQTVHYGAGSDEAAHFRFSRFIAAEQRLPLTPAEQHQADYKSDQPPLFYLMVGWLGSPLALDDPPRLKIKSENYRYNLLEGIDTGRNWDAVGTEDPLRGEVLLWHLGRWATLATALLNLGLVFWLLRRTLPDSPALAVAGTAMLAFIPVYFGTSTVISYEPLLAVWLTAYLLLLHRLLTQPRQTWGYIGLGACLGLACLTKYTPAPLLLLLPALIIWLTRRAALPLADSLRRLALAIVPVLLTFGGWLLYMWLNFNRVASEGWLAGSIAPFLSSDNSDATSNRLMGLVREESTSAAVRQSDSFGAWAWLLFSSMWGESWLPWLFLMLCLGAGAGLVALWRRGHLGAWEAVLLLHVGLLLLLPLVRYVTTLHAATGQGRHLLFPASAIIVLLLIRGWRVWLTPPQLLSLLALVTVLGLSQSLTRMYGGIEPALPIQTIARPTETALATHEGLTLLDTAITAEENTLTVTLWWRVEALIAEDYLLEVTLLDGQSQPQTRWLGQPLNGAMPTRGWLPGDRVRTEIAVPVAGLEAGTYQVEFRLRTGETPVFTQPLEPIHLTPAPLEADGTVTLGDQAVAFALWSPQAVYSEGSTVTILTDPPLADEVQLSLLTAEGETIAPIDRTGRTVTFWIASRLRDGDYGLHFEAGETTLTTSALFTVDTPDIRVFEAASLAQPMEANFANQLTLRSYDLSTRELAPGEAVSVTLQWQARRKIGADLIFFNRLVGEQGQVWGGSDRLVRDTYSTLLWAEDEIITESFPVTLAANAPPGTYRLLVGVYLPVGEGVSLPVVQNGQMTDQTHVDLGAITVSADRP